MRSELLVLVLLVAVLGGGSVLAADPLPSWNHGPAKRAIIDFVVRVTPVGGWVVVDMKKDWKIVHPFQK